jgi:hypothetical protein
MPLTTTMASPKEINVAGQGRTGDRLEWHCRVFLAQAAQSF